MSSKKKIYSKVDFGRALQQLREVRGVTQEDLIPSSSRRSVGRIEQGSQVPSFRTIDSLAEGLRIHPLTLIVLAYCQDSSAASVTQLFETIKSDLIELVDEKRHGQPRSSGLE
ncbi:helix-turn-helix domain-containing protein [Acidovorax sp. LjRoot66]|uniref:helix-turn-helix domain-containing protein n=1 Tax=Acidovorax sp. LjRoot66 TaxID=3342334 RepID=UPI003ECE350C